MGSITLPSTPNRNAPTIHRSFTLPATLSTTSKASNPKRAPERDAVEVLFAHHAARIVSFSPPLYRNSRSPSASRSTDVSNQDGEPVGILPWASRTERTVAAGPLSVYRVPGLVAFLNSGKILHPILAKSRCWCVDGETKFVLRIRENSYYRIELPNTCDEDKKVADNLRLTFARVLQYETTPCPFRRGFYVELPDNPETPKRPWRPKHQSAVGSSEAEDSLNIGNSASASSEQDENSTSSTDSDLGNEREPEFSPKQATSDGSLIFHGQNLAKREKHEHVETIINNFEDMSFTTATEDARLNSPIFNLSNQHTQSDSCPIVVKTRTSHLVTTSDSLSAPFIKTEFINARNSKDQLNLRGKHDNNSSDSLASVGEPPKEFPILLASHDQPPTQNLPQSVVSTACQKYDDSVGQSHGTRPRNIVRLFTAPPKIETNSLWSADTGVKIIGADNRDADAISTSSSLDSFHSLHSPLSPLESFSPSSNTASSSPVFEDCMTEFTRTKSHKHSASEMTITPTSMTVERLQDDCINSEYDRSAPEDIDQFPPNVCAHDPSTRISLRRHFQDRRTSSPLPSTANIYTPRVPFSNHDLTAAIIQKTCSILLGPPVQLIALMLNIAKRIADSAIADENAAYFVAEANLPCPWDRDNDEDGRSSTAWEDDYGLPLSGLPSERMASRRPSQLETSCDCSDVD